MTLELMIAFNLALGVAILSPGPALLYLMRTALTGGWRTGFVTGCGLGASAAGWTLAALLGLDALFTLFPWAYMGFKIAGAFYLIWVAIQTWRHAKDSITAATRPHARSFLGGLMINLANPKAVLFAGAVLVVIFPPDLGLTEKGLITLNHFIVECIAYGLFSLLLNTPQVSRRYLALKPIFDRIAATVLGALGIRLLTDR